MKAVRFLVFGLLFAFSLITSCSDGFPPEFPAPDFSLKNPATKEEVTLSTLRGRPVILYWFTSW